MRRAVALVLLIVITVSGCMSAPRSVASPRTYIPMRRPERIWLVDEDGTRTVVNRPRILPGDTLFGRAGDGEEIWLPLSSIRRVEARELDKKKTMALIGAGVAVGAVFFAISAGSGGGVDRDTGDRPEMSVILFRSR